MKSAIAANIAYIRTNIVVAAAADDGDDKVAYSNKLRIIYRAASVIFSMVGQWSDRDIRGVATWGYMGIYTPKISPSKLYWVKMTSERLLNMSIKFYTSPKKFIPPKQISGYAPESVALSFPSARLFRWLTGVIYFR